MLRVVLLWVLVAAVLATPAVAACPPLAEDEGSAGTTCRWNPYATIECNGPSCWWVGQWQFYDLVGNSTGVRCA